MAVVALVGAGAVGFGIDRALQDGSPRRTGPTPEQLAMTDVLQKQARGSQELLFSQNAAGGSLTGPDDQHLTLALTGVRDWITRFSDRPARDAQTVDVRDFLARWDERFAKSPPNAILSYRLPGAAAPRDIVLELSAPRYDAAEATATYAARRIRRTADDLPGTKHSRTPVVYPLPEAFEAASLFIDSPGSSESGYVETQFDDPLLFKWAPSPTSQCAGYGDTVTVPANGSVWLNYRSYSDHSCAFEPTYARWEVYDQDPLTGNAWLGQVTFSGSGNWVSCTCMACEIPDDGGTDMVVLQAVDDRDWYPMGSGSQDDGC